MFAQEQQVVINQKYVVSSYSLNIREKASPSSSIVGYLQTGNEVIGLKKIVAKNGYIWIKIDRGYIAKTYLTKIYKKPVPKKIKPKKKKLKKKRLKKKKLKKVKSKKINNKSGKYFIGVSAGKTQISSTYTEKVGSFSPAPTTDKDGTTLSLSVGYNFNAKSFAIASYNQTKLDDVVFHNYLLSYNRRFINILSADVYAGVVGGVSVGKFLEIDAKDPKTVTAAYGLQVGVEKNINDKVLLFTQYQYLKAKHITLYKSGGAKAEEVKDNFSNINLGIRFSF